MAKMGWVSVHVEYSIISESQAQQEHVSLSHSRLVGKDHQSKSWKDCSSCKRRFKQMRVKVIKS